MLLQTFAALGLVCGLAYLIFRVVLPKLGTSFNGSNNMVRVVDRVGLDARKSLYVIEVAGKWMLVAGSENGVRLITELDANTAKVAEEAILRQRIQPNSGGKTFADKLNEVISRKQ